MKTKKPQLTISLLASKRPDTIRRCLDSLHKIMEAVSCELILIDTSKSTEVHEILLEYTDQVYEFDWCNNFSRARNEGLRRANGEWFMYLDDDEWFEDTNTLIRFFKSGEYKRYDFANYRVRNYLDSKCTNYLDTWVTRMIRMGKDTRFVSKIHEYLDPLSGKRKCLDVVVHHDGYVYETEEKAREHFERNKVLLLEMIEEEPYTIRWRTQLAQEYCGVKDWDVLEVFCRKCLEETAKCDGLYESIHIGTFHAGLVSALLNQKKYEESRQACQQALADKRTKSVLKALMHLRLGESYFRLGQWEEALTQVDIYIRALQTIDQKEESVLEQKFALLVGEAFESNCQKTAYSLLMCCELEKGTTKNLCKYYDKLGWNRTIVYVLEDMEKTLVRAIWALPYEPIFLRSIIDAFGNAKLRDLFCKAILSQNIQELSDFQTVLYALAESMQGVIVGPENGDMINYHNVLQYYVQATCQWYDFLQEQDVLALLGETNPGYIEAAIAISDYMELESQDKIQALGKLKEAVEHVPEFAEGIGSFLQSYGELEQQRAELQRAEMDALRVQVIGQVKAMIENGQMAAAAQIVGQLRQMFPGDEEVEALSKQIQLK